MRAIREESFTPGRRQYQIIAVDSGQMEAEQRKGLERLKNANLGEKNTGSRLRGENCLFPIYLVQILYPRNEAVYVAKIR